MASLNKVIIIGNLGKDPEVRYTANSRAVCNFTVATNERWTSRDGEPQERTEWHQIVVWGPQAENCGKYLSKGRQACIEGRIQTRKWQDRDGRDRYTTEIVADNVLFLSSGSGGGQGGGGGGYQGGGGDGPQGGGGDGYQGGGGDGYQGGGGGERQGGGGGGEPQGGGGGGGPQSGGGGGGPQGGGGGGGPQGGGGDGGPQGGGGQQQAPGPDQNFNEDDIPF
jgi:single-strand DNA-binding protein